MALAQNRAGYEGFRSWSEDGGIADELRETAAANPDLAKLVPFGTTVRGQEMLAVKVTNDANTVADGSRPAVMYLGAQHAREWITPEMVRRLMHHFIDNYGTDDQITRLVDTTELWFVPVANPDGYDYTFTGDNRLWRKNLQDNDSDGVTTGNDGVDLNRNYATKWGWDNEGSSPNRRARPSAAAGRTPSPSRRTSRKSSRESGSSTSSTITPPPSCCSTASAGRSAPPRPTTRSWCRWSDRRGPGRPGLRPRHLRRALHHQRGQGLHMTVEFGTLGFTPEMTTWRSPRTSTPTTRGSPTTAWRPTSPTTTG